jgi:type IV secretory pathway VirB2 component (pilin)
LLAVLALLGVASPAFATGNPWDTMFTDAGTAIGSLSGSTTTLIGLVFAGIVLLFVGFRLLVRATNKV